MRPEDYVSSACRVGEHEECQRRPVVRCACACHTANPAHVNDDGRPPGPR